MRTDVSKDKGVEQGVLDGAQVGQGLGAHLGKCMSSLIQMDQEGQGTPKINNTDTLGKIHKAKLYGMMCYGCST